MSSGVCVSSFAYSGTFLLLHSSEQGRTSFTSDAFGGNGSSWGFGVHEDEADSGARASWGLQSNPPSTQVIFSPVFVVI